MNAGKIPVGTFFPALVLFFLFIPAGNARTETPDSALTRLNRGIELFSQGKWREAVPELRRLEAEAASPDMRGEALFWIGLSEMSAGRYEEALLDFDALLKNAPESRRIAELPYHRGRIFFYLGRYDEAIVSLTAYAGSFGAEDGLSPEARLRKAAAMYWTGECLFSMGQLDRAFDIYRIITEEYQGSPKYEASVYRLALINQKKVETELLGLLKWSHEEALKNMEEYHRKETFYDQALSAYQKRVAELTERPETRIQELENENAGYRQRIEAAEEKIRGLENSLRESSAALENFRGSTEEERLKTLKESAEELESRIRGESQ